MKKKIQRDNSSQNDKEQQSKPEGGTQLAQKMIRQFVTVAENQGINHQYVRRRI